MALKKGADAIKLAGGALFLAAALALFFKRMPSMSYVEAHADKPRPKTAAAASAAAVQAPAAPKPVPAPAAKPVAAPAPAAAPAAALPVSDESLEDACASEVGLFCHDVAPRARIACLKPYGRVLLSGCRAALVSRGALAEAL